MNTKTYLWLDAFVSGFITGAAVMAIIAYLMIK